MAITLKPDNYKQNLKWSLTPKNKIDTFIAKPIWNTFEEEEEVYTAEITKITVGPNEYNLPLDNSVANTVAKRLRCTKASNGAEITALGESPELAMGAAQAYVAQGTIVVSLTRPLLTMPTIEIEVAGETKYITRSANWDFSRRTYSQLAANLSSYIEQNADGTVPFDHNKSTDANNKLLIDYNYAVGKTIPLLPFVRTIKSGGQATSTSYAQNKLTDNDVLTHWVKESNTSLMWSAGTTGWSDYNSSNSYNTWDSVHNNTGQSVTFDTYANEQAAFQNLTTPVQFSIVKIDDYNYNINWQMPIRYCYYAASRGINFNDPSVLIPIDGFAFMDKISKITVKLKSSKLNTDTFDVKYSLDDNGQLVGNVSNKNPINFTQNEFITQGTTWNGQSWNTEMAKYILQNYKEGKYMLSLDVYANWVIENAITINSEVLIQLLGGQLVVRDGIACVFQVKTIEKIYKAGEFIYAIKLLEK